jgi:hypothetical protein
VSQASFFLFLDESHLHLTPLAALRWKSRPFRDGECPGFQRKNNSYTDEKEPLRKIEVDGDDQPRRNDDSASKSYLETNASQDTQPIVMVVQNTV